MGCYVTPVIAQEVVTERVLLPVGPSRVLGAHGSDWRTHALITNTGNTPAQVNGALDPSCHLPICAPPPPLPPQASFVMVEGAPDCGGRGAFLYVEAARARDIAITLRSRDHSRALETWGTTVPVVYPSALFSQAIGITDIPVEAQFRATLRVLDVNSAATNPVRIRVYGISLPSRQQDARADTLLAEETVTPTSPGRTSLCPAFAELALPRLPFGNPYHALRVEVTPTQADREYWAYVSVIDNVTQHLTILSPTQQ